MYIWNMFIRFFLCHYANHSLKRQEDPKIFLQIAILIIRGFVSREVGVESYLTINLGIGAWWDQGTRDIFAHLLELTQY